MIKRLSIKNYAIIDRLEIDFSKNLTGITGETGAGKSIILGALGLIMGRRADTKVLYNQAEKCVVEGIFDISHYEDLKEFFEENDLDYEKEISVRREITPAGKSRAFVNDTPTTLEIIKTLSEGLLDLHQQFDTLDLNNNSFQLRVLDALAGNKLLLKEYKAKYQKYTADRRTLAQYMEQRQQADKESDFLKFQYEELNKASLQAGEQEALEEELDTLTNAEDIKRRLSAAFHAITESEMAIVSQLKEVSHSVDHVSMYHKKLSSLLEHLNGLIYEIEEISDEFADIAENTEYDGNRIMEIQDRLNLIYKLQKKNHVTSVEDLLAILEGLEKQMGKFTDLSSEIADLEKRISAETAVLKRLGTEIADRRQNVVDGFVQNVHQLLTLLSMEHAKLVIDLKRTDELLPTGINTIRFLFAANKGARLEEIKEVASGGELSRLALVIKSLVATSIPLPTMIFDEIDSGVSGDVAMRMGAILQNLSNEHQVVCITHSPQIAAKADAHYFVYKNIKDDRTFTNIRSLDIDERIIEIAKMLSGNPPSEAAKQNAKDLLSNKDEKKIIGTLFENGQ